MGADTQQHGDDAVAHQTQILLPLLLPAFLGVVLSALELLPVAHILCRLSVSERERRRNTKIGVLNEDRWSHGTQVGLPGCVCVSGGRSKTLVESMMSYSEVILLPGAVFAQYPVSFIQLNKLTMEAWVRWVTVRVKLNKQT